VHTRLAGAVTSTLYEALARSQLVQEYTEAFHKATGLALRLAPASGRAKRTTFGRRGNLFCELVNKATGGCPACLRIQAELQECLRKKLAPQQICCPMKLTDLAVPVVVGGEHVATLFGGQVFRQPPKRRDFERATKVLIGWGISPDDLPTLRDAYLQVRFVPDGQFQAMLRLLVLFAENLAESANHCLLGSRTAETAPVTQAKELVQAHLGNPLTMRALAQQVHLSPCYFCRLFRQNTGLRFTEYVCRLRVEHAKRLLWQRSARIADVAMECGFGDVSYFDRMFKKCVGVTPTEYRRPHAGRPGPASRSLGPLGRTAKSSKEKAILP
jgi:AraC-like DNA-binding protein/ligand-binding sensor protein